MNSKLVAVIAVLRRSHEMGRFFHFLNVLLQGCPFSRDLSRNAELTIC